MFVKVRIDYQLMGERIKNKRNENGISQEKLAETMDVSVALAKMCYWCYDRSKIWQNKL